jgi:hypothetical protein
MKKLKFSISRINPIYVVLYVIPIVFLFVFIKQFSVNVPIGDDWVLLSLFHQVKMGTISFEQLFSQHNEHRMFFPKIIFILLAFLSNWNIEVELWFSFIMSLASFFLIYKISQKNFATQSYLFIAVNVISCIIFFSPVQVENWLWGFQIAWFLIIACMILATYIIVVPNNLSARYKILISASCCFVATFSSAHGLLTWISMIPLLISIDLQLKEKVKLLITWFLLFLCSFIGYIIGYQKPSYHPDTFFFIKKPIFFLQYFFNLIGSPFESLNQSIIIGIIFTSIFVYFNYLFVKGLFSADKIESNKSITEKIAPWLAIGWFTVLFALITAIGRSGFGNLSQATSSRYTSIINLLYISSLQIYLILVSQRRFSSKKYYVSSLLRQGFIAGLLVSVFYIQYSQSIVIAKEYKSQREQGKTCLELIHYFDTDDIDKSNSECTKHVFPDIKLIRGNYQLLEDLNFRQFPRDIIFSDDSKVYGYVDSPTKDSFTRLTKDSQLNMRGWAALPDRSEQPSVVLFSYGNNKTFFANAPINQPRPDVSDSLRSGKFKNSGWSVNVSVDALPDGDNIIKVWIYDREAKKFVRLQGESQVRIIK